MEQHPVPQNVTTFQFRLIGDMTLKQFGYLCAGAILAFIAYKLPMPFIITWPLAGAFAFLGIGFAFIPIEERPMDVWVFSFFKSIYSPTQYIWSHNEPEVKPVAKAPAGHTPPPAPAAPPVQTPPRPQTTQSAPATPPTTPSASAPVAAPQAKSVLSGLFQSNVHTPQQAAATPQARQHTSFLGEFMAMFSFKPHQAPPASPKTAPAAPLPVPPVTGHHPQATQPPTAVQQSGPSPQEIAMQHRMRQLEETVSTLEGRLATKSIAENRVLELQQQLTQLLADKAKTEAELITLKRKAAMSTPQSGAPTDSRQSEVPQQQSAPNRGAVNVITTQEGAVKVGLPRLTSYPNVVTGLVKDDAGNLLPGILVTVTNSDGVPVRALKTNKLGQFAASTQLSNGVYFVEVEDPRGRFTFTRVQITLNGTVVPVLEIIAKSEKVLTREKLAQEIFGKTTI